MARLTLAVVALLAVMAVVVQGQQPNGGYVPGERGGFVPGEPHYGRSPDHRYPLSAGAGVGGTGGAGGSAGEDASQNDRQGFGEDASSADTSRNGGVLSQSASRNDKIGRVNQQFPNQIPTPQG